MTVCTRREKHSLILFAIPLIIAAAAVAVTGWTDTFKLGSPVKVSGPSPFKNCTADNPASQPGTFVANSEVEPRVAVNPKNPSNIVADWSQDWWTPIPSVAARGEVAGVSFDGGKSWQDVVIPGITLCSGGRAVRSADSWLTFAPNGDLYHSSMGNGVPSDPAGPERMVLVSKSTDGGLSWGPVTTLEEDTDTVTISDKDSVTADPTDPNVVYVVWTRNHFGPGGPNNGLAAFSRTLNGGQTWDPPRVIFDPGSNNFADDHQIVVLPDGTLVDFFTDVIQTTDQAGTTHHKLVLSALRSQDRGVTWLPAPAPIQIAEIAFCPPQTSGFCVIDPETGQLIQDPAPFFDVAVNPLNGNLYIEWADGRFSNFQNNSIAFSMSTDGGFTWSAPIKINKTPTNIAPGNQQAFGRSLHVASDGTVGVAYYDFRFNDPSPGFLTDYWLVHCHPTTPTACADPANWRDENRLTSSSFDIEKAVIFFGLFVGDYQGMTADGGDLLSVWSQPEGKDADSVFFQRVKVSK